MQCNLIRRQSTWIDLKVKINEIKVFSLINKSCEGLPAYFYSKIVACHQIFFHQGSISPPFYAKLLHAKITKMQKDTVDLTVFFAILGSLHAKSARKTFVNLTLGFVI
jgi:hypothetical protein